MNRTKLQKISGFTLIEMLFVMVIISVILAMGIGYLRQQGQSMRIDRASTQMQQILNAGLSFYVANGYWPASVACLQGVGGGGCAQKYLPSSLNNPWGQPYTIKTTISNLYVYTQVMSAQANSEASIIAGRLPLSYLTSNPVSGANIAPNQTACSSTTCYIVGSVNIPGQNLNNASAVNFAGIYHHGACVPKPSCPVDKNGTTMTPQVIIVPISIGGVNDQGDNDTVYPISSFRAYAMDNNSATPPGCKGQGGGGVAKSCSLQTIGNSAPAYWRACVQLVTEKGDVQGTRTDEWGDAVTLAAFTRCSIENEPAGSNLNVFSH